MDPLTIEENIEDLDLEIERTRAELTGTVAKLMELLRDRRGEVKDERTNSNRS